MGQKTCVIITSVNGPGSGALQAYAKQCPANGMGFILAGDSKTPKDFSLPGCEYLDLEAQAKLPFSIAALIPENSYSRKNIAYLHAMQQGFDVLVETDDDNMPLEGFWEPRKILVNGTGIEHKGWVNVYRFFSDTGIWPRGFSLNHLKEAPPLEEKMVEGRFCPVQQGLADANPDVDAIYRLTATLPVYFKKRGPVVLGAGSICPFNSQNTTWFRQAFPLLYLPSYEVQRMTDIWRGFIAQRILWANGWGLAFHQATVRQERNAHSLLENFAHETMGYLHNQEIVEALSGLDIKAGEERICENLWLCYRLMTDKKFIPATELPLVEAWISDIARVMG